MKKLIPPFILAAAVLLVYGNTWQNSFHYDDLTSILQRPWIRGLDKISQFIFSFSERPLLILSLNLNYAISEFEVWSYHLFNILGHLFATCLAYALTALALDFRLQQKPEEQILWRPLPLFAALVFALHPLNTQSVTYIASRSAVMATVFYLAFLFFWFLGVRKRKSARGVGEKSFFTGGPYFFAALVSLGCGGLTKEIVMTAPAMAFLFHFYFVSGQTFFQWLRGIFKWLALGGVLSGSALVYKFYEYGKVLIASRAETSSATYFLTQSFVIPFEYFWKMIFPFNLSIDVGFPLVADWTAISNYSGLLALAAFVWALTRVSRTQAFLGFGMAWMGVTILPTSSFVPLLDVAVEHRTYLPMTGFALCAASLLCLALDSSRRGKGEGTRTGLKLGAWAGGFLVLLLMACLTMDRNRAWKDEESLWADAKMKAPRLTRVYNNLGEAYDRKKKYQLAIAEFETAIRMDPFYTFGLNNLGNVYGKLGDYDKAAEYLNRAIQADPAYAMAHYNLATAYVKTDRLEQAAREYKIAIQHGPYLEQAYLSLGHLSLQMGKLSDAVDNFKKFLEMQPKNFRARFALGNAYAQGKLYDKAREEYEKAAELNPDYIFPFINLATVYLQIGKYDEAIEVYEKILSQRGGKIAGVHKNLGMVYYQHKQDAANAKRHFEESLRLEPNQPQASVLRNIIEQLKSGMLKLNQ